MTSSYGILYVSEPSGAANSQNDLQMPAPLPLLQCDHLLGKRFFSISSDGENIIANCTDGTYVLHADGYVDCIELGSDGERAILVSVSCGDGFSVGISDSGHLYSWGIRGNSGQLGQGASLQKVFQPREIEFNNLFTTVKCGKAFTVALDEMGQAYAWGQNFDRQLGIYQKSKNEMHIKNAMVEEMVFYPRLIPLSLKTHLSKVSCGQSFTLAITKDGKLFSWGAGESGQLGTGRCTRKDTPSEVVLGDEKSLVKDVVCGDGHVIAVLTNGQLYSWGLNHRGQCGVSDIKARYAPENISTNLMPHKLYANGHSSAAIDMDGQLWTWGSTRNGRLLHTIEEIQVRGEYTSVSGAVPNPKKYESDMFENSKFEEFCFANCRVATLVKTTLTKVWPMKGPKRSFSRLYIHGFGLWLAERIIVKFSSKIPSIYNPPRSCMAKLIEPGVIVCKPPKFSETGIYTVEVSMDGGHEFLSQHFEILVYKEVSVSQQMPGVIDLRHGVIPKLVLGGISCPLILNSNQDYLSVKQYNCRNEKDKSETDSKEDIATVRLLFKEIPTNNEEAKKKHPDLQFSIRAPVKIDYTATRADEENNSNEGQFTIECDRIDLSQFEQLSHGLFELFCQLSFNDQDYAPLAKDGVYSICHSFHPIEAFPCSYPTSELNRLVAVVAKQATQSIDSFEALHQEPKDFHEFERKVTVTGESLFPSSKLQKSSHIMAVAMRCTICPLNGSAADEISIDSSALASLEELLVHGDSASSMHFTLNSSHLRQVQALITEQSHAHTFDIDNCMVKLFFVFQIETPAIGGMEKILLSEEPISFFFFPAFRLSLSKQFYNRTDEHVSVKIVRKDGTGFPFNPSSAKVRIHGTIDNVFKTIFEVHSRHTKIIKMDSSNQKEENEGDQQQANESIDSSPTYELKIELPTYESLLRHCTKHFTLTPESTVSLFQSTHISLSLDGFSVPQENECERICYYKHVNNYTLQAAVPKGGAPPNSTINLLMGEYIPASLFESVRVRLRGGDVAASSHPVAVQLADAEGHSTLLSFNVPDGAVLSQVPPILNGKDKMYHIDISVDGGENFELAATPMLQVK